MKKLAQKWQAFFKLPELNTVYEVEASEMCDKLDQWLAAQLAEEEPDEKV